MQPQPLLFLGAGGHAREVSIVARAVDPAGARWSRHVYVDAAEEQAALARGGDVVLAVGSPTLRLALWRRHLARPDLRWPLLIHPRADVGPENELGDGVLISSGVITTNNVAIGAATLVNFAVTIGHDATIGSGCALNPGAAISGRVTVGDGCLVGARAVVLEGRVLGAGAIVGAGAVVTHDVAPGVTVVGVPARELNSHLAT